MGLEIEDGVIFWRLRGFADFLEDALNPWLWVAPGLSDSLVSTLSPRSASPVYPDTWSRHRLVTFTTIPESVGSMHLTNSVVMPSGSITFS